MKTRYLALIRTFILCLVGMTMSNLALAACPANPNTDYGSRLILTIRDCTSVADEVSCAATTSPTVFYKEDCLGIELGNGISLPGFGSANGSIQYNGPASLPTMRQTAFASDISRNAATMESWQVYTYGGANPIELPIVGNLTYDYSGGDGDGLGPYDESYIVSLVVWDGALVDVADFSGDDAPYNPVRLTQADCGDEGYFGLPPGAIIAQDAYVSFYGQSPSSTLDVSTGCDGAPVMVNPGDSFIVTILGQATADRGGFVDASNTLEVTFADGTPEEVLVELVDNIEPACGDYCDPEQSNVQIKTGGKSCLNPNEEGMIFASVFGSADMDVSEIRVDESLELGINAQLKKCKERYTNDDDFVDLECKFKHGVFEAGDEEAIAVLLRGQMIDGTPFEAIDTVCLQP